MGFARVIFIDIPFISLYHIPDVL